LTVAQKKVVTDVVREIQSRLQFLVEVGLSYLTLDRESGTLSGGEAQRIRLATQIGSGLAGVLYVLDEPSIGLHQRDNARLLGTLRRLRDLGNSVIVVEHDEETIRAADHIVDLGPGAGPRGGEIVAQGKLENILDAKNSLTADYLSGRLRIPVPKHRTKPRFARNRLTKNEEGWLILKGAAENNLKNIEVAFPLGCFTCVTGVSGSGKSTLVDDILRRALFRRFYNSKEKPGAYRALRGVEQIDKAIVIDQSAIGRTPRSNPVTYTGAFGPIRDLFAQLPAARVRGYGPGRFSFNVKGGRCENCEGGGLIKIEMHFLPDVYVECEVCRGKRYNRETLEITYKGKNIADVLDLTVDEAARFFRNVPSISEKLNSLLDVGLGYLRLGQAGTTLSGGEAQRVKLATELAKKATGRTVYILDEPTTGLHFADIEKLLQVLMKLRNAGNTIIVIEHNLEMTKCADWIVDLGPEGGELGGNIVGAGSPEEIVDLPRSYTGKYLRPILEKT
jgi:excinuclease ABC subunit A